MYTQLDIANKLADLYVSYRGRYGMSIAGGHIFIHKDKGQDKKLTNKTILGHVYENYSVCVFAGEKTSKFMSFDVDLNDLTMVDTIINTLVEAGIDREYIYVSTSGRKGYHIDILFDGLAHTDKCQHLYKWVLYKTGYSKTKVEFRPTHNQGIKIPLSAHGKTGNVCWYLDKEYKPIETKDYIFEIKTMNPQHFESLVDKLEIPVEVKEEIEPSEGMVKYHDMEISMDKLPMLTESGERNRTMLIIAMFYRQSGVDAETLKQILINWYENQNKQFIKSTREEVLENINDIILWVYSAKFKYRPRVNKPDDVCVNKKDMSILMSLKSKGERKVMFYMIGWCKRFGKCKSTVQKISDTTGMTRRNVHNIIEKLVNDGYLYREYGETHVVDGKYVADSNTYRVCGVKVPDTMEYLLKESLIDKLSIDPFEMDKNFHECYVRTLKTFYSEKTLRKLTTKQELMAMGD